MNIALIKNSSGNYIKPSLESTSLAANGDIPADTRISITNSSIENAYPISSFTWIMIYKEQSYNNRTWQDATDLISLLSWMIHDGQQYTRDLNYAPLPPKAIAAADNILRSVTFQGKPVLKDQK
jgi:phosphate transport system substrate-binding protein